MEEQIRLRFLAARRTIIDDFFSRMNPMQKQAVFATEGPVLILAGAGSGKTTVIINRIANMVLFGSAYDSEHVPENIGEDDVTFLEEYAAGENWEMERAFSLIRERAVMPWNILAITFTNKAAGELRERLQEMLGTMAADINASTFHSACVRILRRDIERLGYGSGFTIYDTDDSLRVIKSALKELNIDEKRFSAKSLLASIGRAKDELQTPAVFNASVGDDYRLQVTGKVYEIYQKQLMDANAVDFDDIIMLTVRLFQQYPEVLEQYRARFRYVLVDEYQDTNRAQFELVRLLSAKSKNLCVVGDEDQSIYKFRGATIENILQFEDTFEGARVIRLEQNYRCTGTILNAANSVIEHNTERKGKTLWTQNEMGEKVQIYRAVDENGEARFIADSILENVTAGAKFSSHVILYRMNAQSNMIERALVNNAIPYRMIGGLRFYERKEIKDMVSYLSVINNPSDTLRLQRIINEPKRRIGESTIALVMQIAAQEQKNVFDVLENASAYPALQRKAKDLESFAAMMRSMMQQAKEGPLDELLDRLLEESGYLRMLEEEGFAGQTRLENINELKSSMQRYEQGNEEGGLTGFLEEISLYTDIDRYEPDEDCVVMMTMHSAKGLEFDHVFIAGAEENIFPGMRAMMDPSQIEEERRLAYVSLTRAKKKLYILNAAQRLLFGQTMRNRPSRFLSEIPTELCEIKDATVSLTSAAARTGLAAASNRRSTAGHTIGVQRVGMPVTKPQACQLKPGDTVRHKVFGRGMVLSVTPMGNDSLVEIAFEEAGTKKIMANFARLEREE